MFDFEKLDVYAKAKSFNISVATYLEKNPSIDRSTKDQLKRAAFSIMLNIAEGSGRFSPKDKRNFYIISRGSVFECVAIMDFLKTTCHLDEISFRQFYAWLEELSKMLFAMIKGLS